MECEFTGAFYKENRKILIKNAAKSNFIILLFVNIGKFLPSFFPEFAADFCETSQV